MVRCTRADAAREAQERLAEAGFEAVAMPSPPGSAREAPHGEDVLVVPAIDVAGIAGASAYAHELEPRTGRLAILLGVRASETLPIGLEPIAPFSGIIALDAPPKLLAAQISANLRASVAAEERERRFATSVKLRATSPCPARPKPLKALYVGAPSPHFLALERAFTPAGGLVAAAFTSFSGFDYLHDEAFDAVVLNASKDPHTALSLCAALRRNAQLHHMPTMVVRAAGDEATFKAAIDRGASVVADENASDARALAWLFEAIRRERQRNTAEHDICALRDIMGDPRTGLFRAGPFEAHLERLTADHHASGRPLSIAAMRILPAHGSSEMSPQAWAKGFNEIAALAGRLVRDTDCAAALDNDVIALALPATEMAAARRTAERVASVAECTAFASGEGEAGPLIFEQHVVELQAGESARGLLARAKGVFEDARVIA